MPVELARLEAIFSEALAKPTPTERDAFLDQACGSDLELRGRIKRLLASYDDAGSFMVPPALDAVTEQSGAVREKPGSKIGRYKLLEQIGEGGFGVVFMAEQEQPVRRRVALKVIKLGMDTKQVVARFEAERQALAMMDHPNIAKVLDGGSTDSGRPYFVMELVKGIPITEYCDQQELSTRDRLGLFVEVCKAVQHAHQRGIIHRDIKPSNVLLTLHDDKAIPKVIDFGIAKATQAQLTDKTLFTEFRQLIGTPAYMSPEQAQMTGLDVDTRSDIYSLGVLLYELLTGSTPFDSRQLSSGGLDEMRRIIREVEPPPPSSRLSTLGADRLGIVAHQRHCDPQRLGRLVQGDLDWIVMRCLEKDRARRYDTAVGLAEDIQRHLSDEPVQARPPTLAYRARKFVRRHKVGVLAASAIAAAILLGLTLATIGFIHARRQSQIARKEAARSRQTAQFLTDMLQGVGPSVARGRDTTMLREIVDKTAERVDKDLKDQPEVQIGLRLTLADTYSALAMYKQMEEMARGTLRLARAHGGEENLAVADALGQLGRALMFLRAIDEAEPVTRQAIAMQRKLRGIGSVQEADSLVNLGDVLRHQNNLHPGDQNKLDEAEAALRAGLEIRRSRLGNESTEVAWALRALTILFRERQKLGEAEAADREALAIHQKIYGDEHPYTADNFTSLGATLSSQNRLDEAESLYRKGLGIMKRDEGKGTWGGHQASAHAAFAGILESKGELVEAESEYRQALDIARRTMGEDHLDLPRYIADLAHFLRRNGTLAEARPLAEEAVAICQHESGRVGRWVQDRAFDALRDVLTDLGDTAAVEALDYELLQSLRAALPADDPSLLRAQFNLASILRQNGKLDEASQTCLQAAQQCHEVLPQFERLTTDRSRHQDCWGFAITYEQIAQLLNKLGHREEAEGAYRDAQAIWIPLVADFNIEDHRWHLAVNHDALGHLLRDSGRLDEAAASYQEALAIWEKLASETDNIDRHIHLLLTRSALADLLRTRGESDKAQLLLRDAEAACREAIAICQQRPKAVDAWMQNWAFDTLSGVLTALGDTSTLEAAATQAVQNLRARSPADEGYLAVALANLANILRKDGKLADARPLAEEAVLICQRQISRVDPWMQDRAFDALKQALTQLGDTSALASLAIQSIDRAEQGGNADQLAAAYASAIPLLMAGGRQTEAEDICRKLLALAPKNGQPSNLAAWFLATAEDSTFHEPALAVELAIKAVELNPQAGSWWNTLGVAHYRAGDWQPALEALGKSMELRKGGDAHDWFFLAMTHWQLGDSAEARKWYEQAVDWLDKNDPNNEELELRRFRAEATELMAEDFTTQASQ